MKGDNHDGKVELKGIIKGGKSSFKPSNVSYPKFGSSTPKKTSKKKDEEPEENLKLVETIKVLRNEITKLKKQIQDKAEESYKFGVEEGYKKGAEETEVSLGAQYKNDLNKLRTNMALVMQGLESEKKEFFENIEDGAINLSINLAQCILGELDEGQKSIVEKSVKMALEKLGSSSHLIVIVNPKDFDIVQENIDFWQPIESSIQEIVVKKDERVEHGGCVLESEAGVVDARINGVIDHVIHDIVERRKREHDGFELHVSDGSVEDVLTQKADVVGPNVENQNTQSLNIPSEDVSADKGPKHNVDEGGDGNG